MNPIVKEFIIELEKYEADGASLCVDALKMAIKNKKSLTKT